MTAAADAEGDAGGALDRLLAEYLRIMPVLDATQARIAVGLWRLLAEGAPVTAAALAERLGLPEQQVTAAVDGVLAGTHHRDDLRRIVGTALPRAVMVELRSVPECPNLAPARHALHAALADLGLPTAVVTEVVGDYPSPSILVNGVDVMGASGDGPAACRLDLPTTERISAALREAMDAEPVTATKKNTRSQA